jgi:hypothetical protein
MPGDHDGDGAAARFTRPTALAINTHHTVLAVADTGNGKVRLIQIGSSPDGPTYTVKTIGTAPPGVASKAAFDAPKSVAFDGAGNVYVVDQTGVNLITRPGETGKDLVALAEGSSLGTPASVTIDNKTALVLSPGPTSASSSVLDVTVGGPSIATVEPATAALEGGDRVTIHGANFAPETMLTLGDAEVTDYTVDDANTIAFVVPPQISPGGRTLSIVTRGGVAQIVFAIHTNALDGLADGQISTVAGGIRFVGDGGAARSDDVSLDGRGLVQFQAGCC